MLGMGNPLRFASLYGDDEDVLEIGAVSTDKGYVGSARRKHGTHITL